MVINKIIIKEHKTERSQYSVPRISWLWCQLSFRESSTTSILSQLLPWVATPSSPHYVFVIQYYVPQSPKLKQFRGCNKLRPVLNPAVYNNNNHMSSILLTLLKCTYIQYGPSIIPIQDQSNFYCIYYNSLSMVTYVDITK